MQQQQKNTGLVWFRNNLRVQDNISLKKAIDENQQVIAVYFFDPKYFKKDNFGFKKTEKYRAQFLIETIADLKQNLADLNITLLSYFDAPENKLLIYVIPFLLIKFTLKKNGQKKKLTQMIL